MMARKQKISQAERKHKSILDAAIKVFIKQGFKMTSMDEIAKKAQVSKITVYKHFGNKEKLFQTMLKEHWDTLLIFNNELFEENKSIAANLKNFANRFLEFLYQEKTINLFRLLISSTNQFPNLIKQLLVDEKAPFTRRLIEFLDKKNKSGELKIDNTDRAAAYFMGLLKEYHFWPMMLGFSKSKKPANQNKLIEEAVEIFLKTYARS